MTIIFQAIIVIITMLEFAPFVYTYCDWLIFSHEYHIIKARSKYRVLKFKEGAPAKGRSLSSRSFLLRWEWVLGSLAYGRKTIQAALLLRFKERPLLSWCWCLLCYFVFSYSTGLIHTRMGFKEITVFLLVLCLCLEGSFSKEKGTKKGKKKGKQVYCPS